MRLRRVGGMGAAAVCWLLATACYAWHFGGVDKTVYHRVPEDVPEETWIRDEPSVPVRFEGVFVSTGEDEPTRDEAASMSYSRLLRKARVFATVRGPDVAAPPEPLAGSGRARLQVVYLEDAKHAENLVKTALVPAGTGYRIDLTSTMRQSNAITAEASTGLPVESVSHSPLANRSLLVMLVRPAKMSAMSAPPSPSVLTQNTPFSTTAGLVWLRRLRHTSSVGGASDTEHIAVAVAPALPPGPAVVMTWTAAPSRMLPTPTGTRRCTWRRKWARSN